MPDQLTSSDSRRCNQQLELLREELVVVLEVIAEQKEGLDERTPTGHDFGPPIREQVEGGKVLEDANRIVGAEDGDRAGQADPGGPLRRRAQDDRW